VPKWTESFRDSIFELTGQRDFDYRIAVTRLNANADADAEAEAWRENPRISGNLMGCSFGFLTLKEMWARMLSELAMTPAPSEIGRLAQLLKAAGLTAPVTVAEPSEPIPGSEAAAVEEAESSE
jgi:hypothetical protein